MSGRASVKTDNKKTKYIRSQKGQRMVENQYRIIPERTRHVEEGSYNPKEIAAFGTTLKVVLQSRQERWQT